MNGAMGFFGVGGFVFVFLTSHAIPALLAPFNDVAIGFNASKELLNNRAVTWIGGADEAVVADAPIAPVALEFSADPIAVLLRGNAGIGGGALNFLPMLITAGDEHHIGSTQALETCEGVNRQSCVNAADVRAVVDVIKRCGEGVSHRRDLNH